MKNLTSFILDRETVQKILRNHHKKMIVSLDMGAFLINKKTFEFIHFQNELKIWFKKNIKI